MQSKKLILTFLLFFITEFCNAKSKQPVVVPSTMQTAEGYFDPKIRICNTVNNNDCKELRPGECKYVFPTNIRAFYRYCNESCFQEFDVCSFDQSQENAEKAYNTPCVCARQMTVCGWGAIDGIKLGCIKIPDAPAPPAFYKRFPVNPSVNIVPIAGSDNDFKNPKIGVVIDNKFYSLEAKKSGMQTVLHGQDNTSFGFVTKLQDDEVCCAYLGYGDEISIDSKVKQSQCFKLPLAKKPSGISCKNRTLQIDSNPDKIDLKSFLPKTVASKDDINSTNEQDLRIGDFVAGYVCRNKKNNTTQTVCSGGRMIIEENDFKCDNDGQICSNDHVLGMSYDQDDASNMICLEGWQENPPAYTMPEDGQNKIFKEQGYAFLPQSSNGSVIRIETASQSTLNKMRNVGQNIYRIAEDKNKEGYYKYDQIIYHCLKTKIYKNGHCMHNTKLYTDIDNSSNYKETPFAIDLNPFFLPKDEGEKKYSQNICGNKFCYHPPNPYAQGLCAFKSYPIKCEEVTGKGDHDGQYIIPIRNLGLKKVLNKLKVNKYNDKCDFVRFEAIGGGSAGDVDLGSSKSGSSGGYVRANLQSALLNNYDLIYIKVGRGGIKSNPSNSDGESTEIYLVKLETKLSNEISAEDFFKLVKEKGKLLLKAGGGTQGSGGSNEFKTDFESNLLYVKDINGIVGESGDEPRSPTPNAEFGIKGNTYTNYNDCQLVYKQNYKKDCQVEFGKNKWKFGMGGCASANDDKLFAGRDGAVRITCEKWRN